MTRRWIVIFGCLLALAGCGTGPGDDAPVVAAPAFPAESLRETLSVGLDRISEKYLEPAPVRQLALDGLRGLRTLEPEAALTVEDGRVALSVAGRRAAGVPAPAADDAAGWGRLMVHLVEAGRTASPALRRADAEALLQALFDGTLAGLDPFSRYAGAEEARRNREKRDGFGGVGIRFRLVDGVARITEVLPGTPAARAGLRRGDRITHVGEVPLQGLTERAATAQIHGPVGSYVRLRIKRGDGGGSRTIALVRSRIVLPTVEARLEDGVLVLALSGFNQDTADSLARAVERARQRSAGGLRGVVLDLRGNPGGLLTQSVEVADLFLESGPIISTRGRHRESLQYYEADSYQIAEHLPLAVLIDGKSASAAEIVAAALQDRGRAVVVGTVSFGKGTVQTVLRLPNDGEITLTWSRLMAPSGYALHQLGVLPVICTSGVDGDTRAILADALEGTARAETLATLGAWRRTPVADREQQRALRDICRPRRHNGPQDRRIGMALVRDARRFDRALALAAEPAVARNATARAAETR